MKTIRVPIFLQQRVMSTLREKLALAEQKLEQAFPEPKLNYKQRGTTAGSAYLKEWEIRINPILLIENTHLFIDEVVPHELAHLLVFKMFGRQGIAPHGKEWKWMMQHVLEVDANRTHRFSVATVKSKTFNYTCACKTTHELTIRRHNKVMRGENQYLCRRCGEILKPKEVSAATAEN
ncbi:SprT family zinc-dependent metalloprotease [Providencia alcalifaciens]|uniref:Protein SprT n=1 Tax=Providencia huashanensis TaxID=3037798 RepID=A0AA42FQP6_9GAMM|nr:MULTISPECIES: SprT family zinc-dependent metalloprotease [Providencia]EIL1985155.1 SprT family zinc-dependent metalloprotease [Providencia rettgeri]EIU9517043.1 SprT family zinc-dependent metalloprotease [Providencia rettgeri]EJD6409409.1 SprT family zinc-dependent metalloprotease [Providencia rettgeri]EJD6661706.1 SprT family zinc-dependent metalloprotease [Providencia rettgeri]ELR5077417.1 SprT family zinc-dependent metalloprotease [Providencia rettgeri]